MGRDIVWKPHSTVRANEFHHRLRKETAFLAQWFEEGAFAPCSEGYTVGLELEMWLIDRNGEPLPQNQKLLEALSDPLLVPELSKYNVELNAHPEPIKPGSLKRLEKQLKDYRIHLQRSMAQLDGHILTIGSLPTLRDSLLNLEHMSEYDRYRALNENFLRLRGEEPVKLEIEGRDRLLSVHKDIMLEAAATSFQVHIQPPYDLVTATYNAAIVASAASLAIAANSPILLGCELWEESRIPLFEQAIHLPGFMLLDGSRQQRVTFGHGYAEDSLYELFLENAHAFPVLLPALSDEPIEKLSHLNLQNSTIWRWNRPVLDFTAEGRPSLRVEHRVMSAGPSDCDMVADLAFVLGLCHELAPQLSEPEVFMPFAEARQNFYAAARQGLEAKVSWGAQKEMCLRDLILDELLPAAKRGLRQLGLADDEITFSMDEVLAPRVAKQQTGAAWQRKWLKQHGFNLTKMTQAYLERQNDGGPVHDWTF